jgi:hypothetical protein
VREMKLPLNLKMKEVVGKSVWRNYTLKNQWIVKHYSMKILPAVAKKDITY